MTPDIGAVGIWGRSTIWNAATEERGEAAAELDELGFGALWLGSSDGSLALHEELLDASRRLVLASGIVNIWTNPPRTVSDSYHRLGAAHPGRFLLGLGISHAPIVEAAGETYTRPLARLRSYLDELDALPDPVPRERRVLAALGPKALTLAAERSAGAHPYLVPPEHTAVARAEMGPNALLAVEQMVVLDRDAASARDTARSTLAMYLALPNYTRNLERLGYATADFADGGSDRLVDALVAWGDAGDVAERVAAHHNAGADHVCIQVLGVDALPRASWRTLAPALAL